MRTLVTGGAGFIGSHVVEGRLAAGDSVVVLDDLSTGRRENLSGLEVDLRVADLRDPAALESALEGVEGIVHLAGFVSVPGSIADPVTSAEVNILGTVRLIEAARRAGTRRIVFASSAATYGEVAEVPVTETVLPAPTSPYGVQKLCGEHLLRVAATTGGPDSISFRFFNVYGARQSPTSDYAAVIPIFRDRAAKGLSLRIFGDGRQTRDFIHVGDVTAAIGRALEAEGRFDGRVFNLARGESTTIEDLARAIVLESAGSSEIEFAERRAGDIEHSVADIAALRTAFGWTPPTALDEGLRRM